MTIRLTSQVYVGQWPIFYGPANLLHVLKTIYSRKFVLGMIDQCHSETDIVNYILPYIILLNLKYFIIKKWLWPEVFVTLWALALVLAENILTWARTGPRSLVDKRVYSWSIRFLIAVVQAWLGSYVGKPSSAYGWSGGFSPGSPVFAHLRWTIRSI